MVRVSGENSKRSFSPTTRGQEKKNRCYIQYVKVGEKLSLDILFNIELMYCYDPLYVRLEFPEKYIHKNTQLRAVDTNKAFLQSLKSVSTSHSAVC
jgi:hypothetical protein